MARDTVEFDPVSEFAGGLRARRLRGVRAQIAGRDGVLDPVQTVRGAVVEHASAVASRTRTEVHDPVRGANDLSVVFHDEDRIAVVLESLQRTEE